ncbi:hypothetical protein LguiB_022876 [Lonicera macranthoides]
MLSRHSQPFAFLRILLFEFWEKGERMRPRKESKRRNTSWDRTTKNPHVSRSSPPSASLLDSEFITQDLDLFASLQISPEETSSPNPNPRSFPYSVKQQCWEKAEKVKGRDPDRWRRDHLGNTLFRKLVGCPGCLCHDYDHIVPYSKVLDIRSYGLESCQPLASPTHEISPQGLRLSFLEEKAHWKIVKFYRYGESLVVVLLGKKKKMRNLNSKISFSASLPDDVCGVFEDSICAVKYSMIPFADVRESIVEMIKNVGVQDWSEMEELVYCYIVLNSSEATVNRSKGNRTEISRADLIQKSSYCRVSGRDMDLLELSAYGNVRRGQDSGGCNIQ